ncbi:MAG: DUF2935 domain-containing protein [Oscillospiraceae bacterium]|nr:DUF2935 domain-containing protein [Oscillospiraceae bacterium]MDY6207542.1 DUF2935 domain-containing protein [Oscillospiraceae bacterium]
MHSDYITESLELHLFFGRIMKEHSLFLEAGYTPINAEFAARAEHYKNAFERLLSRAVTLGNGIIRENVLASGEIVTEFTKAAEQQTEKLTGIHIDSGITDRELRLNCCEASVSPQLYIRVKSLNIIALRLLDGLISLKEETLDAVLGCTMLTMNYPLLIEHIIREAKLYRQYLRSLEDSGTVGAQSMKEVECFWNRIMMEHAMFIRGLLDPSEAELIQSADGFAKDYAALLQSCNNAQDMAITAQSKAETMKFKAFKTAGTKGIESCQIRSLILPLLADHVLREADHFLRILGE